MGPPPLTFPHSRESGRENYGLPLREKTMGLSLIKTSNPHPPCLVTGIPLLSLSLLISVACQGHESGVNIVSDWLGLASVLLGPLHPNKFPNQPSSCIEYGSGQEEA